MTVIKFLRSLTAGNRPTGRTYGEPYVNLTDGQFGVVNNSGNAQDLLGVPIFSTGATYQARQPVNYGGQLYISLVAVSPGAFNPAQWTLVSTQANYPLFSLSGFYLSYVDGTHITIGAGSAMSGSATAMLTFNNSWTKNVSAAWSAGNNGGAMESSSFWAPNNWYQVFVIGDANGGSVDFQVSANSAPVFPPGYSTRRYIGQFKTAADGSGIIPFLQEGDDFYWKTAQVESGIQQPISGQQDFTLSFAPQFTRAISVLLGTAFYATSSHMDLAIYSTLQTDITPGFGTPYTYRDSSLGIGWQGNIPALYIGTTMKVRCVSAQAGFITLWTRGWKDPRGR